MPRTLAPLLAAAVLLGACAGPPPAGHHAAAAPGSEAAVLLTGLGTHHRPITTGSAVAQAYFDQGLRLLYAFNHLEAQRAFREAARLDPSCAMCYWGIALTEGGNYNDPTNAEREKRALTALQAAQALAGRASPVEQALIAALAERHSADPRADRAALDRAYAEAMGEVARRFRQDTDAATLHADALMNLRPWNLWLPDGSPQPETEEIVRTLERVLSMDPDHPGALHLYIHAVEAGPYPGRAAAAADRLRGLLPGAGHLVHMPSHIYFRVGRYADAEQVNVDAVAADRAYLARRKPSDIYQMLYYPHNIDFVWQAAGMQGRAAATIRAAREFAATAPVEMVRKASDMETALAAPVLALARFGRWDEVLREPEPPADLPYVRGAWHYARGLAHAAAGRRAEAQRELAALESIERGVPSERSLAFFFKTRELLQLARLVLTGEIAGRAGQTDAAVRALLEAVAIQDGHWFTEPPPWYFPVRQALGAVLLDAGRAAEAEAVYRDDLRRNPDNGWSLHGLARSLRAQQKTAEAALVEERFRRAWARADVSLSASRF
jgi:tetratricopeptide (TPR) repeat protein